MTENQFFKLLREISATKGFVLNYRKQIRQKRCPLCPIVAVARKKGHVFTNGSFSKAAEVLGLDDDFTFDIVTVADYEKTDGIQDHTPEQLKLRKKLVKACGLEV